MKNQLILTITTVRGSRQYSLGALARYLVSILIIALLGSFVISNLFLFKTSDELSLVEGNLQELSERYETVLGTTETYRSEVGDLAESLHKVQAERDRLQYERSVVSQQKAGLDEQLYQLEAVLGLPRSDVMTADRAKMLQLQANERLFLLHGVPNGWPVEGSVLTDSYGPRKHPVTGERKHHDGLDFRAAIGTPVYATADGAVNFAGYHKSSGYGNLIILEHNFGFKTYYGHLKKTTVRSGQVVRKGQLIAYSGNTGISTGPHLHYEVRYLHRPMNPKPFLNWGRDNYESLFSAVKGIPWDSLREMHPLSRLALP